MMIHGDTGVLAERAGGVGAAVRTYGRDAYLVRRISEPKYPHHRTIVVSPACHISKSIMD